MKFTPVFINLIFSLPLCAFAQGIPPSLEIERVQGTINVVIRNVGATPMTACVLTYCQVLQQNGKQHEVSGRNVFDVVTNPNHKVIAPGGTYLIKLGVRDAAADPNVQIRGGLYEDGSAFGDTGWVGLIRKRRSAFLESSTSALEDFSAATSNSRSSLDSASMMKTALSRRMAALGDESQKAQADASGVSSGKVSPFDADTPAERSARLALLASQDHANAVNAVYSALIQNLKTPPTSNGSPVDFWQTINILRTKLTQDISRLRSQ